MLIRKGLFFLMSLFAIGVSMYALSYLFFVHPFLEYKEERHDTLWNIAFHMHFIGGAIALSLGWIQFWKKFRDNFLNWHRRIGQTYIIAILIISSTSGLYLSFHANGGFPTGLGFGTMAILWFLTTLFAFSSVRKGNITNHQKWMIRSYAITYAAVMLRIWMPFFIVVIGVTQADAYLAVSWFSWVPNLIIAEIIISRFIDS